MEIKKLSKLVAYDPQPESDTQKLRIIQIAEYNKAFNEQLLCMDGEICFKRILIEEDFKNWKTSEKVLFQRNRI